MAVQIVAALGFLAVAVGVPLVLVLWSRRTRMYSGRAVRYDGPPRENGRDVVVLRRYRGQRGGVVASGGEEDVGRLSVEERERWEQLVDVSWNLPARGSDRT